MAVTKVAIAPPSTRRAGRNYFRLGTRACAIFNITKLTGETTYNLATGLERVDEVIVLDDTGAVISGAVSTTGQSGAGTFTSALSVLGAGTFLTVICIGSRATR